MKCRRFHRSEGTGQIVKIKQNVPDNNSKNKTVVRCALSAQIRPSTTTRSHNENWAFLALNRSARRRATFSAGVSDGLDGDDGVGLGRGDEEEEALGVGTRRDGNECDGG
jgi:hypothetical protein